MSEKRARFIGHPDGAFLESIPVGTNGETRRATIPYGGELPTEIDGQKVSTAYRDSLLEQKDNWTLVNRATGEDAKGKSTAAKADEKEA